MGETRVRISGPIFDGSAERIADAFTVDAADAIAQQGVNDVKIALRGVLENPTGNYERHIQTERQSDDMAVTDSGVVYGPWLEGVSSRNQSSRFKGYATFRQVSNRLQGKATGIAERMFSKYAGRMN
jgi:hypothetical protein